MTKEDKAVKATKEEDKAVKAVASKGIEIEVSDPEIARPKELPLVVKPKGGKWANQAQEEFAKIVNAYAYANPDKWHNDRIDTNGVPMPNTSKKHILIKQLEMLETAPAMLAVLTGKQGDSGKLQYKNKLIEN